MIGDPQFCDEARTDRERGALKVRRIEEKFRKGEIGRRTDPLKVHGFKRTEAEEEEDEERTGEKSQEDLQAIGSLKFREFEKRNPPMKVRGIERKNDTEDEEEEGTGEEDQEYVFSKNSLHGVA
jgi:hypothetical protein